jgi:hypothetical protein
MQKESYAFPDGLLPFSYSGHTIGALKNEAYTTVDGRLSFHFILWCVSCNGECVVRGRLPPEYSSVEHIQTAKILALSYYRNNKCSSGGPERKVYMS